MRWGFAFRFGALSFDIDLIYEISAKKVDRVCAADCTVGDDDFAMSIFESELFERLNCFIKVEMK